jgi:8-oxo-dGTP diphosphatase
MHPGQLSLSWVLDGHLNSVRVVGRTFRAIAGGVIVDKRGAILLLHRIGPPRQWELPGGKIERGESPTFAAARELDEELGIRVDQLQRIGQTRFRQHNRAWRYFWFVAEHSSGIPTICEPDRFDRLAWFTPVELTHMMGELSPNVRKLVCDHFDGRVVLPCPRSDVDHAPFQGGQADPCGAEVRRC